MPKWLALILGRPARRYHIILNVLSPFIQIALVVWLAVIFRDIPEQIPTNYDFSGAVTSYGSKEILWVMPVIGIVSDIVMWAVQLAPRDTWNTGMRVRASDRATVLGWMHDLLVEMRLAISVMFAVISVPTILGRAPGLVVWAAVLIFIPLARYIVRSARLKR